VHLLKLSIAACSTGAANFVIFVVAFQGLVVVVLDLVSFALLLSSLEVDRDRYVLVIAN
jgi:hypothetical protein